MPYREERLLVEKQKTESPTDRRVGVGDFPATLYRHLGLDADRAFLRDPSGRPVPVLQQAGSPIRELVASA